MPFPINIRVRFGRCFAGVIIMVIPLASIGGCASAPTTRRQFSASQEQYYAQLLRAGGGISPAVCLAANMERSTAGHRAKTGRYRHTSALFGGLATAVGALTATFIGAFNSRDTKTAVGLIGGTSTAVLGVLQTRHAAGSDPAAYVGATDRALTEYLANRYSTHGINADSILFVTAADIKSKYPEWADFTVYPKVSDPNCEGLLIPPPAPAPAPPPR